MPASPLGSFLLEGLVPDVELKAEEPRRYQWGLCDPVDYTVHGILQARILQWVAFPFSRGSSQPTEEGLTSRGGRHLRLPLRFGLRPHPTMTGEQ